MKQALVSNLVIYSTSIDIQHHGHIYFSKLDCIKELRQLQLVQNAAAKCMSYKYKHDHIDNDLEKLHWLNVRKRIVFKALLLVYKSITGSAPMYLQQLFSFQTWGHSPALVVPAAHSAYGRRAISYLGPKLWNKMPKALKEATSTEEFKSKLKT